VKRKEYEKKLNVSCTKGKLAYARKTTLSHPLCETRDLRPVATNFSCCHIAG
jgi:hypothetical protein